MITSTAPSKKIDITLYDGICLVFTLQNLTNTIGEVSKVILFKLCEMSEQVDMICARPTYGSSSVKYVCQFQAMIYTIFHRTVD